MSRRARDGRVVVVGDDSAAAVAARSLPGDVLFVGPDEWTARRVADDVAEATVAEDIGQYRPPESAEAVVVATSSDSTNLLLGHRLRTADAETVVRLNDRSRSAAFEGVDADVVCAATRVGESLVEDYAKRIVQD